MLNSSKLIRGNVFDKLFRSNFIPMPTVMIRRKTLAEVGIFNPKYEIAEEYDLWLRIAEHYPIDFTRDHWRSIEFTVGVAVETGS